MPLAPSGDYIEADADPAVDSGAARDHLVHYRRADGRGDAFSYVFHETSIEAVIERFRREHPGAQIYAVIDSGWWHTVIAPKLPS